MGWLLSLQHEEFLLLISRASRQTVTFLLSPALSEDKATELMLAWKL